MQLQVLSVLLVLLLVLIRGSGARVDGRLDGCSMLELVGRNPRTRTEPEEGLRGHRARETRSQPGPDAHPRDPRHKERFIKHLTGPLYFNPKCRKHFNRLYHNTRDCTIPAYYKRCARLLTRLANSPRCTER